LPEFQCAVAAAERNEHLFATASQVRRWLLIEVRGTWPNDAIRGGPIGEHAGADWRTSLKARGLRPIAIRRDLQHRDPDGPVTLFYVEAGHGPHHHGRTWRREIEHLGELADATDSAPAGWQQHTDPILLVCTHGRHDPCCATFGRPLVRHLHDGPYADNVWESSHVGGDRFAANLVMLPDSLYFGRVTAERVDHMIEDVRAGRLDLDAYRGRSTLGYAQQAAEHFVRTEFDLVDIGAVVEVRRTGSRRFEVDLADGDIVAVELQRTLHVPGTALTCSGPTGAEHPVYRLLGSERRSTRARRD